MFHRAVDLNFKDGTILEVTFADGKVKQYDMRVLFTKYPQLCALEDRKLFLSGRLLGYGIIWTDELDVETETIYENGKTVRTVKPAEYIEVGNAILKARAKKGISQKELSDLTGIDQSDISKIERGVANPSVGTLRRLADALDAKLVISLTPLQPVSKFRI